MRSLSKEDLSVQEKVVWEAWDSLLSKKSLPNRTHASSACFMQYSGYTAPFFYLF